jgi:hypothetical protein
MPFPAYMFLIEHALQNGYRIDTENGSIFGLTGKCMSIKLRGKQRYPTVPLVVRRSGVRRVLSVPAHKVIAFALWDREAFAPDICVRHLDGNTCNNRRTNLSLGTNSQNNMDKDPEVRRSAAILARASQPRISYNAKLLCVEAAEIKQIGNNSLNANGRVQRGVVQRLALKYGLSKSAVSRIIHDASAYQQENL